MAGFNSMGALIGGTQGQNKASNVIFGNKPQTAPSPAAAQAVHPGVLPSTPVKKITSADGTTTEFHAPQKTDTTAKVGTTSGVLKPVVNDYKDQPSSISADQTPSSAAQPNVSAQTPPDTTYPGMIGGAVSAAQGNIPIGQAGRDIAGKYGGLISQEQQNLANQLGNIETSGTTLQTALGREGVLNRTSLARQQALTAQGAMEQTGVGQQLTAEQQAQSGMLGAAGLTPGALRYGGAAGGTLNPLNNLDSIAQQVINKQISPAQAKAMGGGIDTWEGALNQALLKKDPNYNEAQAQGTYDATQGAAGTQAGTVQSYTSALQQGQNLQSQLTNLISTFGLNPADINKANAGLQIIANNVSDPRYKILQNYVNDIANTYAQVLTPPGGSQTDTTRGLASSMLDSTMAGQGLITVMKSLDEAAKAKIAGVPTAGGAGTSQTTNTGKFQEGAKSSDSSLIFKGGKWVKA